MRFSIDSETGVLREVLLCKPDYYEWMATSDIACESISGEKEFCRKLATEQHAYLVETLENAGVKCQFLDPDPYLPDLCWTRDSSQITPWGVVITRLSEPSRRRENQVLEDYYHQQFQATSNLPQQLQLEGGDIHIVKPGVLILGYSQNRTAIKGAREFARPFLKQGWKVHLEPVGERFVHLDVIFCMAATGTALVCREAISDELMSLLQILEIDTVDVHLGEVDLLACNCLSLGNKRVIVAGTEYGASEKLKALGIQVFELDMSMFTLAGGGVHCLTQPLRRDPVI